MSWSAWKEVKATVGPPKPLPKPQGSFALPAAQATTPWLATTPPVVTPAQKPGGHVRGEA